MAAYLIEVLLQWITLKFGKFKVEVTKKGCHTEALEVCARGIANYALAVMH